jgi:hypothetical protein
MSASSSSSASPHTLQIPVSNSDTKETDRHIQQLQRTLESVRASLRAIPLAAAPSSSSSSSSAPVRTPSRFNRFLNRGVGAETDVIGGDDDDEPDFGAIGRMAAHAAATPESNASLDLTHMLHLSKQLTDIVSSISRMEDNPHADVSGLKTQAHILYLQADQALKSPTDNKNADAVKLLESARRAYELIVE